MKCLTLLTCAIPLLIAVPAARAHGMPGGPPAAWAQPDPADSLYRVAREALNRGDYRRAAQLFNDLTQRFPNSAYAYVSTYYEAFSRYRIGTTEELRAADRALQTLSGRYAAASNGSRDDTDVNRLH